MKLLEMNHIKKNFDGVQVIKDISVSVEQGEILAIIGPSGSGKSTLLRCATMLETISDGEILYLGKKAAWIENGKPVFPKKEERKEIQSCFGLVFQNFNLFPHFSVMKNITDAPIKVQKRKKKNGHWKKHFCVWMRSSRNWRRKIQHWRILFWDIRKA